MRSRSRSRVLVPVLVSALLLPGVGHAVPDQMTDQLDAARERLEDLDTRASRAVEEYNVATAELEQLEGRQARTRERVEDLAEKVAELEEATSGFVRSMYMRGPTNAVTAMLDAEAVAEAGRSVAMVDRLSRQRHVQVEELARRRLDLDAARAELDEQVDEARQRAAEVDQHRDEVEALLTDQRDDVEQLQARIAELEREEAEQERRERAAAEQRAQRQQEQASATRTVEAAPEPDDRAAPRSERQRAPEPDPAPDPAPAGTRSGAGVAVDAAMSQLGDPYRWAGAGPDSYDCSGLTMWAWRHAGVSLPHSSRMQYSATTRVSRSQLQPGDLVFFGSPIHHVAMYIGGGRVVEAPSSGKFVRVNSSSLSRSDITGYGRV